MPSSSASPDPASPADSAAAAEPSTPRDPPAVEPFLASGFYELLQLPPTATARELRQSFRLLSKRYHPDTTTLPAPVAARAFQRLQRAYSVLSDPQSRRLYDERLRLPAPAAFRPPQQSSAAGGVAGAPVSIRRALSGGEWFALLLLAVALVLSLVLGIGVAWARGAELVRWPSWLAEAHPTDLVVEGTAGRDPGDGLGDGMVGKPQSSPLTADASHVPAS